MRDYRNETGPSPEMRHLDERHEARKRAEWRAARLAAYRAGAYAFRAPPVCTVYWGERDWCNFVRFIDPALNGFDDGRDDK